MIVYFSGTGNSRYCADYLGHALNDEVLDAFRYIKNGIATDLRSGRPWIFVCPTYAWRLPRIFRDFIRSGSFAGNNRAYFVMTCGDSIGNAGKTNRALCGEKGLLYSGTLEVVMPENYIALFDVPPEEECHRLIRAAGPTLDRAAEAILAEKPLEEKPIHLTGRLESGPINPAFYKLIVGAKKFYATDACVGCGKCVESCPTNCITMENGIPHWGKDCTHCMACICGCPVSAIEYGRASRGKVRYRGPVYSEDN